MADDDAFLLAAAELLEQQHQQRNATQNAAHIPRPSQPSNFSSAKQLSPSVLKRIEANRAAALSRLQKASAAALNSSNRTNPSIPPPRASSPSASEAESLSSQASITSYFKPDASNSCSVPREGEGRRRRQRPLSDINNVLSPPSSPVSSQRSVCSDAAVARSFKPFAPSASSQSHSRPLPCAACAVVISSSSSSSSSSGCSRGCVLEYPQHLPVRQYQLDLVQVKPVLLVVGGLQFEFCTVTLDSCWQRCVTHNTLIVLPTGLGKTFIAGL
jgi:hypothetical protein